MALEVVTLGYSRKPWRIVLNPCPAGEQHSASFWCLCQVKVSEVLDHSTLGRITVSGPLGFDRKRDAVAALAKLEAAR